MEDGFDLSDIETMFKFIFQLYNFVSHAKESCHDLADPAETVTQVHLDVKEMDLSTLTGVKRKANDPGDGGNAARKQRKKGGQGPQDSEKPFDVTILEALRCAGYTIPPIAEGFHVLLPVRAYFPWKGQY